jgi:hypothetical protein
MGLVAIVVATSAGVVSPSEPDKYKSVRCASDPGANDLKATVTSGSQPSGYCTNDSPDLQAFHSNPDLCGGGSHSKICALAQWTIHRAGHYTWTNGGPDFVYFVLYLDGVELQRGLRYEASSFEVPVLLRRLLRWNWPRLPWLGCDGKYSSTHFDSNSGAD